MYRMLVLILLSFGLLGACQAQQGRSTLVVGSDLDNSPWAAVDKDGQPVGRDVTMMNELAARTGQSVEWSRMPFDNLLSALERGEIDVVCATMGVTTERQKRVAFTRPYYRTVLSVVARSGVGEPTSRADLANRTLTVAVSKGTTSEEAVRRELPSATIVFEDRGQAIGEMLRAKSIDAAVMDGPVAEALVASSRGELVHLTSLGGEDYSLAVRLGQKDLLRRLNQALEEMERCNELASLNAAFGLAPSLDSPSE